MFLVMREKEKAGLELLTAAAAAREEAYSKNEEAQQEEVSRSEVDFESEEGQKEAREQSRMEGGEDIGADPRKEQRSKVNNDTASMEPLINLKVSKEGGGKRPPVPPLPLDGIGIIKEKKEKKDNVPHGLPVLPKGGVTVPTLDFKSANLVGSDSKDKDWHKEVSKEKKEDGDTPRTGKRVFFSPREELMPTVGTVKGVGVGGDLDEELGAYIDEDTGGSETGEGTQEVDSTEDMVSDVASVAESDDDDDDDYSDDFDGIEEVEEVCSLIIVIIGCEWPYMYMYCSYQLSNHWM